MKIAKGINLKSLLMSLLITLVLCSLIGGTVAWLVDKTEPVENTFTYGDINIDLDETDTNDDDDNPNTNKYPMNPGKSITKDPKVTFIANSENAWLFVKLEKSENFDQFMEYEVILDDPATTDLIEGWTALDGVEGVYYMAVNKVDTDTEYFVIKDNTVKVKGEVTKEMLNALDKNEDGSLKEEKTYPTLTVTAYAVQRDENIAAAADAWNIAIGNE